MKVLFDHQIFDSQEIGGASRMFSDLIRSLRRRGIVDPIVALKWSNNEYVRDIAARSEVRFLMNARVRGVNKLRSWENRRNSCRKIVEAEFDIFHPTYYDTYFLERLRGRPFVITILDMIHEKWPELFSDAASTTKKKKLLVERASRIVAISRQSKEDIVKFFHTDPDRIEVVYPATSLPCEAPGTPALTRVEERILYVGTRTIYKNFERFVRAVERLTVNSPKLRLLCVGGGSFTSKENGMIRSLGLSDKISQVSLADGDLGAAYSHSLAFVFPSLYEGFGIPILEAFNCGCPVILSNIGAFPEVAGDAAVYFNPESIDSMVSTINTVIQDVHLREELVKRGKLRLTMFNPEKVAEQMESVYQKAV